MKFLCLSVALALFGLAVADPRIINGNKAKLGQFPYQVSVLWSDGGVYPFAHICSGAIISPQWILTAAHALKELPRPGPIRIRAGIVNLDDQGVGLQTVGVSEVIVHPKYNGPKNGNDIALLKLTGSLQFNDLVKAVPLSQKAEYPEGIATFSGWGSTAPGVKPEMPKDLQYAKVPLLSGADCEEALNATLPGQRFHDDYICAGPLNQVNSACVGDSGDPLVQDGELIGVAGWTVRPCGDLGVPSVFTMVGSHLDFISSWVRLQ